MRAIFVVWCTLLSEASLKTEAVFNHTPGSKAHFDQRGGAAVVRDPAGKYGSVTAL
jgi:hypothetical protein